MKTHTGEDALVTALPTPHPDAGPEDACGAALAPQVE